MVSPPCHMSDGFCIGRNSGVGGAVYEGKAESDSAQVCVAYVIGDKVG